MANVIKVLILLCYVEVDAQESRAVSKFIEAATIQTGLQKEVELSGKTLYIKLIPPAYSPYFDAGITVGNILINKQVYLTKSWEF